MTDNLITVVSGFGRCGSSLMMRMLEAGGYPVYYTHPISYETEEVLQLPQQYTWLDRCIGKAVKINDPHRYRPPATYSYHVIWLDRDSHQQACSQAKFLRALAHIPVDALGVKQLAKSLRRDHPTAMRLWRVLRARVLQVAFEDLVMTPFIQAGRVEEFLGIPLDTHAMTACVKRRPVTCLPYLLEAEIQKELEVSHE